jgi:hypothetical protein
MSSTTLGRKRPRDMTEEIMQYVKRERNDLNIKEQSGFEYVELSCLTLCACWF